MELLSFDVRVMVVYRRKIYTKCLLYGNYKCTNGYFTNK